MNSPSFVIYDVKSRQLVVTQTKPSAAIRLCKRPSGTIWSVGNHFARVDAEFGGIVELPEGNLLLGVVSSPHSGYIQVLEQSFRNTYFH